MSNEKFKLPGSSYAELIKIIQAYARQDKPASLDDITKVAALDKTVVSRNNAFLMSMGLIEGGKAKAPTALGKELGNAMGYEQVNEIERIWRNIVEKHEFLSKLIAAIRIRKGMEETSLRGHIAYSAGQAKTAGVMTGAGAVIDILQTSGLVKEVDGQITPAEPAHQDTPITVPIESSPSSVIIQKPDIQVGRVNIEVQIKATPDDLDGLGDKLKKFLKDMAKVSKPAND